MSLLDRYESSFGICQHKFVNRIVGSFFIVGNILHECLALMIVKILENDDKIHISRLASDSFWNVYRQKGSSKVTWSHRVVFLSVGTLESNVYATKPTKRGASTENNSIM